MTRTWKFMRTAGRIALWVVLSALGGIGVALGLMSGNQ